MAFFSLKAGGHVQVLFPIDTVSAMSAPCQLCGPHDELENKLEWFDQSLQYR